MKILFVDVNTAGHHMVYFNSIMSINGFEKVLVLPKKSSSVLVKQYEIPALSRGMKFNQYVNMLVALKKIIKKEQPDIVHFLTGDMLYRYFGVGLSYLNCNVISTFHHVDFSFFKKISYKLIFHKIKCGIVHTKYIQDNLKTLNINNVNHIEYPFLEKFEFYDKKSIKSEFNLPENVKILLAFGETRYDKGIDILLKSLDKINSPFYLIIAGKTTYFTKEQISELSINFKNKVRCFFYYINDELMNKLFCVSDIVVLPYRKKFSGASGPLTGGVFLEKLIIGPNNNSLGSLIRDNHLGYTFIPESINSLEKAIDCAINNIFICDNTYKEYKKKISKEFFLQSYENLFLTYKKS